MRSGKKNQKWSGLFISPSARARNDTYPTLPAILYPVVFMRFPRKQRVKKKKKIKHRIVRGFVTKRRRRTITKPTAATQIFFFQIIFVTNHFVRGQSGRRSRTRYYRHALYECPSVRCFFSSISLPVYRQNTRVIVLCRSGRDFFVFWSGQENL